MPGRRSAIAVAIKNTEPQRRNAKRSLNALAIAEEQTPVRSKIRQHRLGQSELEPTKRKRNEEGDHEERDEGSKQAKRRRSGDRDKFGNELEEGSDSSGNEWVVGQVGEDDDSDLDSDEAMGESDEEKFEGFAFRGSSAIVSKRKDRSRVSDTENQDEGLRDIDLREDEDEDEDEDGSLDEEDDGLGDDAVDLAAMLDASDNGDDLPHESSDSFELQEHNSQPSSDEDAEGGNSSAGDEESMVSFSGEEEPGDSAKLASLQALVSNMNERAQESTRTRPPADAQESTTPSDFGLNSSRKLTVADMIPSITDPRLRKSLKLLANPDAKSSSIRGGIPKKLDVPLPKRQQDRLDRTAAYEKSKETLKRWIDTVKHNRRAEHLSFPILDSNAVAAQGSQRLLPTSHSQPLTDLESTIQNILQDSGLAAPNGKSEEDQLQAFEELKTNKMPLEEVQARRAELRRTRELLFREEIRAKRIKKIKSKTYRKVHRKERERIAQQEKDALTAAGVEDSESEQERRDRRRAEERMGARHRESKWAKGVKESGRVRWDEDARGGVTEMARRGEELKRRIEGKNVARDQDEDVSSESESEEDDEAENGDDKSGRLDRLYEKASGLDSGAQGSKLASMDFMKRAESARKARNDSDVEAIRRELAGEEISSEEESTEGHGRQSFGPMKNKPSLAKTTPKEQKSDFEERNESDFGDEDSHKDPNDDDLKIVVDTSKAHPKAKPGKKPLVKGVEKEVEQISSDQNMLKHENPWLTDTKKASNGSKRRIQETDKGAIISNTVVPAKTASVEMPAKPRSALKGAREAEKAHQGGEPSKSVGSASTIDDDEENDEAESLPFVLRNQDLVRKAFAGDEVVADFAKEKQQVIKDDEEKIIDNTLPGWGSWTGAGISKKQEKRNKGKVLVKEPGIAKEKRQDAKFDRVIINEKRVKKNSKYLASNLPHPFETRQQYERSLRIPVGPEWTTKETFQSATKPRILMKQGVIKPMEKPMI